MTTRTYMLSDGSELAVGTPPRELRYDFFNDGELSDDDGNLLAVIDTGVPEPYFVAGDKKLFNVWVNRPKDLTIFPVESDTGIIIVADGPVTNDGMLAIIDNYSSGHVYFTYLTEPGGHRLEGFVYDNHGFGYSNTDALADGTANPDILSFEAVLIRDKNTPME